jgi:beta-glucosidase
LLAAIKQTVSPGTKVTFSPDGENLAGADAVIVVVGEQPYAETKGDRSDLSLAASDAGLIKKAKAAGVPVVTLLYSGRPLVLGDALGQSDAFVAAWLPGTEGQGMADVLFGDFKPTGKLPRPWPADNSQLNSMTLAKSSTSPLFASGFGLTYGATTKP